MMNEHGRTVPHLTGKVRIRIDFEVAEPPPEMLEGSRTDAWMSFVDHELPPDLALSVVDAATRAVATHKSTRA